MNTWLKLSKLQQMVRKRKSPSLIQLISNGLSQTDAQETCHSFSAISKEQTVYVRSVNQISLEVQTLKL